MINDSHLVCPEDLFAGDYESEFFQQVVHSFLDVFVSFELRFRGFLKRKIDKQSMMINQQDVDGTVKKKPGYISKGCHRQRWWHNMINTKTVGLLL